MFVLEESSEGDDGSTEKVEDVVITEKFESLHIMSIGINRKDYIEYSIEDLHFICWIIYKNEVYSMNHDMI